MVGTSWAATAASVATSKSPPIADARPSASRQPAGSRATRSAIVAVITGGRRSASSARGGLPSRSRTVSVTNNGLPRVRSTSTSTSGPSSSPDPSAAARARDVVAGERFEHHLGAEPAQLGQDGAERRRRRRVLRAVGHQQAGPALAGGRREVHEQRQGGRVGPVSVVEHREHRRARRGVADAAGDGVELGHPLGGRVAGVRRRAGEVAAVERAEDLPPRPQPRQRRRLRGGRPGDLPPLPLRVDEHGVAQCRFAHPRLARDEHHPADAVRRAAPQLGDPAEGAVAPLQPTGCDHSTGVWRHESRSGSHARPVRGRPHTFWLRQNTLADRTDA